MPTSSRTLRTLKRAAAAWRAAARHRGPRAAAAKSRFLRFCRVCQTPGSPCAQRIARSRGSAVPYTAWTKRRRRTGQQRDMGGSLLRSQSGDFGMAILDPFSGRSSPNLTFELLRPRFPVSTSNVGSREHLAALPWSLHATPCSKPAKIGYFGPFSTRSSANLVFELLKPAFSVSTSKVGCKGHPLELISDFRVSRYS